MRLGFCTVAAGLLGTAGCPTPDERCPAGEPGCACAGGTCPPGLECVDEVCVFEGDEPTTSGLGQTDAPPSIIEVFPAALALKENGTQTVTVQVTDSDGLDDIVGGVLRDTETAEVLLVFSQLSQGTYTAELDWGEVDAARTIEFEFDGDRSYAAEFTDRAGNIGSETLDVTFDCGGASFGVCGDGVCRSLLANSDCGGRRATRCVTKVPASTEP